MIPKGSQRGGGQQLATHLLNEFDNDRVEIAEVRGAIAPDLHGAFAEWAAISRATRCTKYLYSLSVNPDPRQRPVTREELYDYIGRAENALGLSDQPRAVIFHVKYGREHCHVVWSRVNGGSLRAVQISHDRQKLRSVTREFAREHALDLPPGMKEDRGAQRYVDRQKIENLAEKQQEERSGIAKAERMEAITAAWRESDSGKAFVTAIEERGYFLARGDKRAHVVVDLYGEIHSLSRQIRGVKSREIRERLADFPADKLPDARKAQDFARAQLESRRGDLPPAQSTVAQRRDDLARAQQQRRAALAQRRRTLLAEHRTEREALRDAQESEIKGILTARLRAQPRGVIAFLARITGIRLLVAQRHKRQDRATDAEHERQRAALARRHRREALNFRHNIRALDSLDKRERRSLETALRREDFRAITHPRDLAQRAAPGRHGLQRLTREQRARLDEMKRAGLAITTPIRPRERSPDSRVAEPFNRAAAGEDIEDKRKGAARAVDARERLEEIRRLRQELTKPPASETSAAEGLSGAFGSADREQKVRETHEQWRREQERLNKTRKPGPGRDRER
jgi:hypothetical protein